MTKKYALQCYCQVFNKEKINPKGTVPNWLNNQLGTVPFGFLSYL